MSLTVFLALCVLGIDFMIYALFQWTYSDKRSAIARQVAVQRNALKEQSPRPFLVTSQTPLVAPSGVQGRVLDVSEVAKVATAGETLFTNGQRVRWSPAELSRSPGMFNDFNEEPS